MVNITGLRADPRFRELALPEQLKIAQSLIYKDLLATRPDFLREDPLKQRRIVEQLSLSAATFEDEILGERLRTMAQGYAAGENGTGKATYEFVNSAIRNSGIAGLVSLGLESSASRRDRGRALEYLKYTESASGRRDPWGEVGSVLGFVGDIVGVNAAMKPLTSAANVGIQAAARGVSRTAFKAAEASKIALPILRTKLAAYAPIAAESAIEAVPYFIVEEGRRKASGQPGVLESGAGEVLKTLGVNAAADFVVGTALTATLRYLGGVAKGVFKRSDLYDVIYKNEAERAKLLQEFRAGTMDPRVYNELPEITRDDLKQGVRIADYLERGAVEPDVFAEGRTALLAHDLGKFWGKADDGSYHVWELNKDTGRARKIAYANFNDVENSLALSYYKKHQKALDLDIAGAADPDYVPKAIVRPDLDWAVRRGKLLFDAEVRLHPASVADLDEDLAKAFAAADLKPKDMAFRPIVTKAEADNLAKLNSDQVHVVETAVPLKGAIIENANERNLNLLRGQSGITVTPSDMPNAVLVGVNAAPLDVYQAALTKADELAAAAAETGYGGPSEQFLTSLMLNAGFDHVALPDGTYRFFSTRALRLIGGVEHVIETSKKALKAGDGSAKITLSQTFKRYFSADKFGADPDTVIAGALRALRTGEIDDYQAFGKAYLRGYGSGAPVRAIRTPSPRLQVRVIDDVPTVFVPSKFATPKAEEDAMRALLDGLDEFGKSHAVPGAKLGQSSYLTKRFTENIAKFGFPADVNAQPWVRAATESAGGKFKKLPDGRFQFDLPSGSVIKDTLEDAQDFIARHTMDEAYIQRDLLMQGIRVHKLGETSVQLRSMKTGELVVEAANLRAALAKMGWAPRTVSNSFAPTEVTFGAGGFKVTWFETKTFSNWSKASKFLARFEDHAEMMRLKAVKSTPRGTIFETPARQFEVYSPKYDVWRRFDNAGDAGKFLATEVKGLDDLKEIAYKKLLDVTVENNRYVLQAPDGTITRLDTQDALAQAMREYPDVEKSVRSIIDTLDPTVEATVGDIAAQWRKSAPLAGMNKWNRAPEFEIPDRELLPFYTGVLAQTESKNALVEFLSLKSKDPKLLKLFRAVEAGQRAATIDNNRGIRILDTMFRDDRGKYISKESRQKIFYWMGMDSEKAAGGLATQFAERYGKALEPLNPLEQRIASQLKEYFDSLSTKFPIPFEKLIKEYMPRLRDIYHPANRGLLNSFSTAEDLVNYVFQGNPPKALKFWAENERLSDFSGYFLRDDALEVAMLYTAQGHKKLYMNKAWQELNRYTSETGVEPVVGNALKQYREQVMGMGRTMTEKNIEIVGEKLFGAIKRSPIGKVIPFSELEMEAMGRNILSSVMGLTYFTSMGWKPFLAIRNTFQTWTMAGARLGNDWVARGWKALEGNMDVEVPRLRKLGVLSEKPPIVNQVWSHSTKIGRFMEKSLEWFKNSDDLTRAWTYKSAELKFSNASDALLQGKISTKEQFFKLSGLSRVDPVLAEDAWAKVATKDPSQVAQATHNFSLKITEETMFGYRASESPTMFQGAIGKLFGQFGTYSAGFRANVARMFAYGTTADKVEMVTTYLATSAALWGTFSALKIKTNDFIPFAPAIFTGGPMFDVAVDAVKSTGTDYEAEQARARLGYSLQSLAPGSAQKRYIEKFLEYSKAGDPYRAWLSLTSVPVIPD